MYHPIGGCGSVTTALGRICKQLGVEIRLNEPAEEILVEGHKATGVRTTAGEYKADAVVVNADFVRGTYQNLSHHTIYISKDYIENMEDVGRKRVLSGDSSYYVQNAWVTDRSLAPWGKSTLYVLVPVTHQSSKVDWERERRRFRELVLTKLANKL